MSAEEHLEEARKLYQKARQDFEKAKEKNDSMVLGDACGKGWLSTIEAAYALLIKKGIKEEELPKTDRGRRYSIFKHADRELELVYKTLRDDFHIEGYYDGTLSFEEMERRLDDLNLYIQRIGRIE